ncbi:E3 ubiquitin-protein ligase goliath-like isoform X2 [Artemia franciscana]|uniref:E3 ubiquitin-protein ligase goliath-like isoform X2 n=1 Tax=Artemia franciscana TaxID=6661 RepID=UPI0032DB7E27
MKTHFFCLLVYCVFWIDCMDNQVPTIDWTSNSDDYIMANMNITYWDDKNMVTITERGELAKFGTGKIGIAKGKLFHIINNGTDYGCEKRFKNHPENINWVALVRRGKCYFDEKIEAAFASNASAVIVYNNRDDGLQKMTLKTRFRNKIVSVFMSRARGEELARLLDNGTQIHVAISIGTKYTFKYTNINRTSVMFVSISFIVLMVISLGWLIFYYVQRFRYLHARDKISRQLVTAAQRALSKVPTKMIKGGDVETGEVECCAICIEPFKNNETIRHLPCKHDYHKECIDPWLLEHRTCPMCKMDILKHYGYVFAGSQESILNMDLDTPIVSTRPGRSGPGGSRNLAPDVISVPSTPQSQRVPSPISRRLRLPISSEGRWTWGRGFIWSRQGNANGEDQRNDRPVSGDCQRPDIQGTSTVAPFSTVNLVIPTISVIDTSCHLTDTSVIAPAATHTPSLTPISKNMAVRTL